jgi:hypothetical protein
VKRTSLLASLLLLAAFPARAATYVDAPPVARSTFGVAVLAGTSLDGPLGSSPGGFVGGGGAEVAYGTSWESGWCLRAILGGASWSARSPLGIAVRDRDASLFEGWTGLAVRRTFGDGEVAPFVSASLALDVLRVRAVRGEAVRGEAFGYASAASFGVRLRESGWSTFTALELRHARLGAPSDGEGSLQTTRASLVIGFDLEGALR